MILSHNNIVCWHKFSPYLLQLILLLFKLNANFIILRIMFRINRMIYFIIKSIRSMFNKFKEFFSSNGNVSKGEIRKKNDFPINQNIVWIFVLFHQWNRLDSISIRSICLDLVSAPLLRLMKMEKFIIICYCSCTL